MTSANAHAEGIEVVREVLLESGKSPFPDMALAQTKDRGYVIAGTDQHRAWATRVDSQGRVRWRYTAANGEESAFEDALVLADDSVLLCGFVKLGGDRGVSGLLTHIDKDGRLLAQRELRPGAGGDFKLNYLRTCVPWGDGAAVLGNATRFTEAPPRQNDAFWLLALDGQANVKWEQTLPNPARTIISVQGDRPVVAKNGDLVVSLWQGYARILRLDLAGRTVAERRIDGSGTLVRSLVPDGSVNVLTLEERGATLRSLGEKLEDQRTVSGRDNLIDQDRFDAAKAIYLLPDRSLLIFGGQREDNAQTAAIVRFDAELRRRQQTFLFEPRWTSIWVAAAVPTGKPAEFATVRQVGRIPRWPNETRVGVALAIVRVK